MRRRTFLAICATGIAGLAGCGGDTGDPTTTETTTDTATETTLPEEAVVDYDALSSDQQDAFEQARNETVRFSTGVPGLEEPIHYDLAVFEPFRNHDYVRKGESVYELSTDSSGLIGGTRVTVESVEAAENDSATSLDNRTGEGIELIQQAIETDGNAARIGVDPPESIAVDDVVEHGGEHYRVTQISNRDYEYFTLTVRPADG